MRIAFDGSTLRPGRTGVGYYTEHLLHHLARQRGDDSDIVVISNRPVETSRPLPANVRVSATEWRGPRLLWLQTRAPRMLRELDADVVHFTNGMIPLASPVPTVVTIHDMSLTMYPRYHPPRRVLLNRPLVHLAARRADAVITVSESARRDILHYYNLTSDRVHVVHEAAAPWFRPVSDETERARVRQAYGLGERFILYVGTIEPRKNLPLLIDAFAARRRGGELPAQLVCAGPYGWLCGDIERRVERRHVKDAVRFTGYVPMADLPVLYSLAEMFVFPSLYEGFGLPVVEAMACGAPVITGRVAALEEVAGGAVEHVPELSVESLGDVMVALAGDPDRRAHLRARGLIRAATFSWDRAARETLAVYRQVARSRSEAPLVRPAPFNERGLDESARIARSRAASRETEQPGVG